MPVQKTYTTWFDGHLDHPDTQRLAGELERLGLPRRWRDWVGNIAPLLNLYCLHNQEDGDVTHLPAERIAQICRWPIPSKAEDFVGALKCSGILEEHEHPDGGVRYVVHNFRHYCRRLLNERERKRNSRRQTDEPAAVSPKTLRGQYADAGAERLAPIVIGTVIETVNGNVKDRERTLTAVTNEPEKPKPAGASRPSSEISAEQTAGNGERQEGQQHEQGRAQAGSPPAETTPRARVETARRTEAPAPRANGAGTFAGPVVVKPDADPMRPEDVQNCLSMLAELLRRWGWDETATRRFLKWLIHDSRGPGCTMPRGAWVHRTCEGDYWRILGFAKQIEERKARGGDVKDSVSLLIHMLDKGYQPTEQCYRLAKSAWIFLDGEGERTEPIWIREILAAIGTPAGVAL
jgi:hypothetical protein